MQSVLEDVTESGSRQEWFDAVVTMWSLLEESGSRQNGHHLLLEDAAKDVNIGVLQLTPETLHYIYTTLAVVSLLSLICFWHLRTLSKNRTNVVSLLTSKAVQLTPEALHYICTTLHCMSAHTKGCTAHTTDTTLYTLHLL